MFKLSKSDSKHFRIFQLKKNNNSAQISAFKIKLSGLSPSFAMILINWWCHFIDQLQTFQDLSQNDLLIFAETGIFNFTQWCKYHFCAFNCHFNKKFNYNLNYSSQLANCTVIQKTFSLLRYFILYFIWPIRIISLKSFIVFAPESAKEFWKILETDDCVLPMKPLKEWWIENWQWLTRTTEYYQIFTY